MRFTPISTVLPQASTYKVWMVWSGIIAGIIIFLWLVLFRQPLFPAPWFDEGLNVSTAAMLAREGLYALPNSDGPRIMDPAIQTGPTVLVPVALIFDVFGSGLIQARLVLTLFTAIALIFYLRLARSLGGNATSMLAIAMLIAGSNELSASFVPMGRQVLGEVAALAYFLLGMQIWLQTVERDTEVWPGLIMSGLAWGIAMLTKSQVLLLLPICLGVLALLDRFFYHQAGWRAFLTPGMIACTLVACWYLCRYAIAGPEASTAHTQTLGEGFWLHIVSLEPAHWSNALSVLWRTGFWLWGVPGLAWGLWLARSRTWEGLRHAMLLAFPVIGLIWFVGLSVGWGRYAFYIFTLTPIWTAGLIVALWRTSRLRQRFLACGLISAYLIAGQGLTLRNLVMPVDTGYLEMRNFLQTQLPAEARIEMWEWELSMDAPQSIHHPPTEITNTYTRYLMSDAPRPLDVYDPWQSQPEYILEGPFSGWTGIYREALVGNPQLVVRYGQYALYRVHPPNTQLKR